MSYPTYLPSTGNKMAELIDEELGRARRKFPMPNPNLAALVEEVGEVARAMMEKGSGSQEVIEECVQVAAMAIRVATEGDSSFPERGQEEQS